MTRSNIVYLFTFILGSELKPRHLLLLLFTIFALLFVFLFVFFFFFQAEDGIRDYKVTGVQTCALPIFLFNYYSANRTTAYESVSFRTKAAFND